MKKFFYFASALLTLAMVSSCAIYDNNVGFDVDVPETFTIVDENGNKYETDLIATFSGEIDSEVTLGLGVYDRFDIYGVDFGDGNIVVDTVCAENGGLKGEDGLTMPGTTHTGFTKFNGTVAGNGTIKVYGKSDIWYLSLSGGAMPTSFDQEKLQNVVQVTITGANVESIELPALEKMTQFHFNNSPLKSIDVSKATALTSLAINSTSASKYEPQLTSIDVSKNTELDYLSLQGSNKASGKLTKIDLSNNTKLTKVYLNYNQITEIILGDNIITDFNASDNNLESFDMSKLTSIKNIYLSGNKLKDLDLSVITNKGNIQIQNNLFTLATLPTKPEITSTNKYTYAPQPAYEVAEAITDQNNLLDLSSQLTATGILTEPATTTFTLLAGTTELKEGEDYQVVEPGKFTFLKPQAEKVHAVMATAAFPKFTGNNAYVTTEFTVNVSAAAEAATIFTATPIAAWDAPESAETEITSELATITGGKLFAINQQTAAKAMIKNQGGELAFQCTNNNTFFKIVLDKALEAGDVISIRMQSRTDTDLGLFFAATDSRPNETTTSIILPTAQAQAWTNAPTYTVKTDDGICGQSTFYAFRATAKSTYFNTFTITRK